MNKFEKCTENNNGVSGLYHFRDKIEKYLDDALYNDTQDIKNTKKTVFTVGELRKLIENIPDDTVLTFCEKGVAELLTESIGETTVISKHLNLINLSVIHNGEVIVFTKNPQILYDVEDEVEYE